jgi:hypothetical protein
VFHLAFGCLVRLETEARVRHGFLNDRDGVISVCTRIDAFLGDQCGKLFPKVFLLIRTFPVTDLQLAFLQNLSWIRSSEVNTVWSASDGVLPLAR